MYTDEFLEHVVRYLFPPTNRTERAPELECEYLSADEGVLERWFKSAQVRVPSGRSIRIRPKPVVEAFLTSQGVGLLSVSLGADGPLDPGDVVEFNYRLSQFRRKPVSGIVKQHPADDPERYARLAPEDRAGISPKPAETAPIEEQLASPYGAFSLEQLVVRLVLSPLRSFSVKPVEPRELAVYTVVRLPEVDFADPTARAGLAPLLAGLAQIEEGGHPGTDPTDLSVPAAVLNRRHWAAVGVLGAAHLVADEGGPGGAGKEFNHQRVRIVRDKYFVSFLVGLLQRMTLNRAVEEAAEIFTASPAERPDRTARLRRDLLRFGVGGQFNQINSRHAHHRYYQLCRAGLDVVPGWQDIRQVLAELDADRIAQDASQLARDQAEQQKRLGELASGVAASVTEIERLQSVVHIIEYLLGSVYGAHLLHMAFAENHTVERWLGHIGLHRHDGYETAITLAGAAAGAGFVYAVDMFRRRAERLRTG